MSLFDRLFPEKDPRPKVHEDKTFGLPAGRCRPGPRSPLWLAEAPRGDGQGAGPRSALALCEHRGRRPPGPRQPVVGGRARRFRRLASRWHRRDQPRGRDPCRRAPPSWGPSWASWRPSTDWTT